MCVWPGHRGVGIGRLLLEEAFLAARKRDIRRIRLSVENGNPATRLYRDMGFSDAAGSAPGTMVVCLRP